MIIREKHEVIIEKYPYFESMNKRLLEDLEKLDYPHSYTTNVKAKHTDWQVSSPNIDKILSWVTNILRGKYSWIGQRKLIINFPDTWFVNYDEGEYTVSHDHVPSIWSWVYYVNTPKGSSPLIFTRSGKKVKAEAGKLVLFPSSVYHYVPPNKCKDRIALSANVTFS